MNIAQLFREKDFAIVSEGSAAVTHLADALYDFLPGSGHQSWRDPYHVRECCFLSGFAVGLVVGVLIGITAVAFWGESAELKRFPPPDHAQILIPRDQAPRRIDLAGRA
jgi:hypothetical protein